jgi:hypothetical protein
VKQHARLSVISKREPPSQSIFELAEKAGVRLRPRIQPQPFDNQFVRDLVDMRRCGLFQAVWIDADRIRVRLPDQMPDDAPRSLSRIEANMLITAWKAAPKKPSAVAVSL